jgi:hypothetical protein
MVKLHYKHLDEWKKKESLIEFMTTYEKLKAIRYLILNKTMSGYVYKKHWGNDFRIKEIDEIESIVKKWETNENLDMSIDPSDLTNAECDDLGFGRWSKENPMRLIPIWIYPFLKEEFNSGCIDGNSGKMKKSEMDTDTRFGYLAYGIYPKDCINLNKIIEKQMI